VGRKAGLDEYGNFAPNGIRSRYRPGHSESLYQLRYPGHFIVYSRTPLIRTLVIPIGLAVRVNFARILEN
jgi:hypothetical protein